MSHFPGGNSANEYSPFPPLFSRPGTRRGVSIAELVDEENSSSDTRGGVNRSSYTTARVNVSVVHPYPPLTISVVDVTPCPSGSEGLEVSRTMPLQSSLRSRRKAGPLTAPETIGQRVTRSTAKRKAAKDFETETRPSKRTKSLHSDE